MKFKITLLLLVSCIFGFAQTTNFTNQITNPSFETGNGTGWTWASAATWLGPNNDGDATKDGIYINGLWNNPINFNQCSQTISGLPAGNYTLSCLMTVSNNRLTNQRLFAKAGGTTKSMLYGSQANYSAANLALLGNTENYSFGNWTTSTAENGPFKLVSVNIDLAAGEDLTIGIRVSGTANTQGYTFPGVNGDAGFFKFDAFTLTGNFDNDASLSSLTTDVGTLSPVFSSAQGSYKLVVPTGTANVNLTATASSANATVSGAGTFSLTNSAGLATIVVTAQSGTRKTYTVNIINGALPTITLLGNPSPTIEVGTSYVDAGATATDNQNNDLTSNIVVGGDSVDTNTVGTYVITYNVSDGNGNAAVPVTRTIKVVPAGLAPDPLQKNLFPLSKVVLLEGPFKTSMDLNIQSLLQYDADRLLEPYLKEAGLTPKGARYVNWEPLSGHVGGHYLSALAMHYAATKDVQVKARMDYMISELKRCQDAKGNGYVGGVPNSDAVWNGVRVKDFSAFWAAWVPWYNIHKTYAGLRDAWLHGGSETAKQMFLGLCDWGINEISGLTTADMQNMLNSEFGGMNEVYADAYEMTGDIKYLNAAKKFTHNYFFDSFVNNNDNLDNQHANTQIPKFVGFASVAQYDNTATNYETAASNFWNAVVDRRSVAFGGNSRREFFPAAASYVDFTVDREGPESCNTYNMLKLTSQLHMQNPNVKYADYYETALFNHILSTQHPDHGGYVYFTPTRSNHYRVYSSPNQAMWCCVGTGMENHGKHGQFIYSHNQDKLFVNLFIASRLTWAEKEVTITQTTNFPAEETTTLTINGSATFDLMLRYPKWVTEGKMEILVNGSPIAITAKPGEYVSLNRNWNSGDVIKINMPMHLSYEVLPNVADDHIAFKYGPILLGAKTTASNLVGLVADDGRWAHIAAGKLLGSYESPIIVSKKETLLDNFQKIEGENLKFKAPNLFPLDKDKELVLEPFSQIHDSRYMIYWPTLDPAVADQVIADMKAKELQQLILDERTIDYVSTGEQQPEADHKLKGSSTNTGIHQNEYWRDATNGGFFSYELATGGNSQATLMVRYWGNEGGSRTFDILVDDVVISRENVVGKWNVNDFVNVEYAIDPSLLAGKEFITVKFQAIPNNNAGGVFYLRLLKNLSNNASLSDLKMDNASLIGFNPETLNYTVEIANSSGVPLIEAVAADVNASVEVVNAVQVPGSSSIVVTAEDLVTTKNYTINFTEPVIDTTKPLITLLGNATETIQLGMAYTDAGVTAVDDIDGILTSSVVVVNPVNVTIAGTYTITYNVVDNAGNNANEVTRTVIVKNPVPVTKAYVVTPTCPGAANGKLNVSTDLNQYAYTITVKGGSVDKTFTDVVIAPNTNWELSNLAAGTYELSISAPGISFVQNYSVVVNEINKITAKRSASDKAVSYTVSGSDEYLVTVNGVLKFYNTATTQSTKIGIDASLLQPSNLVTIATNSDCQGVIEDSFALGSVNVVYPNPTTDVIYFEGVNEGLIQVYNSNGMLLIENDASSTKSISLKGYATGVYLVKIVHAEKVESFKVILK